MKPKLSLKGRALQLLAQREQSRSELRRKLTRHAAAAIDATDPDTDDDPAGAAAALADQVDGVIAWLEANGLSSNERFVESRVQARLSRLGNLRIRAELSQHGVALGGELAQRLKDSELQRAHSVWSIKFGHAPQDAATHARQYRFLAGRGFSPETIRETLRQATRQAQDPTTFAEHPPD